MQSQRIELEYEGVTRAASYVVGGGVLRVWSAWGERTAEPGSEPGLLARILFREILDKARKDGAL